MSQTRKLQFQKIITVTDTLNIHVKSYPLPTGASLSKVSSTATPST